MKLNNKAKQLIDANIFCILQSADKGGSGGRWPMPILKSTNDASIFSEPKIAEFFYQRIKKLQAQGKDSSQISQLFPYPSPLARLTMIFRSRKIWNLTKEKQIEMMNHLAEILYNLYRKDHYCRRGRNILLSPKEQFNIFQRIKKVREKSIPPALVAKLDGRLWLYTEMIYSRWHNLGHEFHGPYNYAKKRRLMIKEWHDLQGLGTKVFLSFPYQKIACYEIYQDNKVNLDIHNRLKTAKPLAATVKKSFVQINGKFVGAKDIVKAIKKIDSFLRRGQEYLASLTATDLKENNAFMEFYTIKPLADALKEDWRPPVSLLKDIKRGRLSKAAQSVLNRLSYYYPRFNKTNARIQWDPSVNFK